MNSRVTRPADILDSIAERQCLDQEVAVDADPGDAIHLVEPAHRVKWVAIEELQVASAPDFKIESGKWYRALAEIKGDEVVIQFANGPTLYGKHASFTGKNDGFGVAGPKGGTVELDNVTVWSVKPEAASSWAKTREGLPKPEAVVVKKAPEKKKKV